MGGDSCAKEISMVICCNAKVVSKGSGCCAKVFSIGEYGNVSGSGGCVLCYILYSVCI